MTFNKITEADIIHFKSVLGPEFVLADEESLSACSSDETEDLCYPPELVLRPGTTEEVSLILRYCNEQHIPVTPRGAGTGLSGGALAVFGGVMLDMRRFNKILNIDYRNFQVTTEPGVITQVLQEEVRALGMYYPPAHVKSFRLQLLSFRGTFFTTAVIHFLRKSRVYT